MSESQSYHVVAKGLTSLGLIVAIGFGPLLAAEELIERYWSSITTTAEPWVIPLFVGFAAGAGAMIVARRLGQTRVNAWYVYFESYFETLRYPVNPDGEDDRSVRGERFNLGPTYPRDLPRDDPHLIAAVEANKTSDLSITEVPADTEWVITEYDGAETVREKHRTFPGGEFEQGIANSWSSDSSE